jgi:arylsulfatase A-like enzyme
VLLHLADRSAERVAPIVRFLQKQDWVDTIFTRDGASRLDGTFPLSAVHGNNPQRGADIVFTLAWASETNPHGAQGTHTIHSGTRTGPLEGVGSGHGGLNPWLVRNTLIAWGPAFKTRTKVKAPAGIVDVAPTVLSMMGLEKGLKMEGRVLREALEGGPGEPRTETNVRTTRAGSYAASIQTSRAAGKQYVDKAWRVR